MYKLNFQSQRSTKLRLPLFDNQSSSEYESQNSKFFTETQYTPSRASTNSSILSS